METKFITFFAAVSLMFTALASCSSNNDDGGDDSGGNPGLRVDQTEITGSLTQAATFKIIADANATWELKSFSHRINFTPTSGTGPATISVTCIDLDIGKWLTKFEFI